jgi:hypothetical protein
VKEEDKLKFVFKKAMELVSAIQIYLDCRKWEDDGFLPLTRAVDWDAHFKNALDKFNSEEE